jgi:hypothetical protein
MSLSGTSDRLMAVAELCVSVQMEGIGTCERTHFIITCLRLWENIFSVWAPGNCLPVK